MTVLVVSPHLDDETLGAGGTILRLKNEGEKVFWLNITNVKREYGYSDTVIKKIKLQMEKVSKMYNFDGIYDLELCPAGLHRYDSSKIIEKISNIIKEVKPNIIILPNRYDAHSDHKIVFDWCYSCTKVFRYPYINQIMTMEILSETDFSSEINKFAPNYFIDISDYFNKKLDILRIYEEELGNHPFPRSIDGIEALAKIRGIGAGKKFAEAFKIIKYIY